MKRTLHSLLSLVLAAALLVGIAGALGLSITLPAAAEEPEYYVIDSCDTKDNFLSSGALNTSQRMQGKASIQLGITGSMTLANSVVYGMEVPDDLSDWYLQVWFYVADKNSLNLNQCELVMACSNDSYYSWKFGKFKGSNAIRTGWNRIQVQVSSANDWKGKADFTAINYVKLNLTATKQVAIHVDDICLSRSLTASDKSELQEAVTAAASFDTTGGSATNIEKFTEAKQRAEAALANETCSQRDAEVAAEVLNNAMNAFGFEGFEADEEVTYGYIDFATMKYNLMDGFRVDGGALSDYADRHTAGFTDQLLVNAGKKYVAGSNEIRFTVTYFDAAEGGLELQYGSADGVKTGLAIEFTGDERWKSTSVRVADAALARSVGDYDYTLKAIGGTAYVSRVEVKVITEDDLSESAAPEFAAQTETNNIIGASTMGYQMWFSAGESIGDWVHWGEGSHPNPAPGNGNYSFDVYPYVQDYIDNGATLYKSDLGLLGDGSQSMLFSSKDPEVVETHFQWISEAGVDCMAIQRFGCGFQYAVPEEENHLVTAINMAEKYDRAVYVMYDVTGQGALTSEELYTRITTDWVLNVEQSGVATSTAYAHAENKPVVCIWGISGDAGTEEEPQTKYPKGDTASRLIRWFHDRGYYVIIGTPDNNFSTRTGEYVEPFAMADMISPWSVGRYAYGSCNNWIRNNGAADAAFCEANGNAYQPVIFPGFSWIGMLHGGRPNAYPRMAGQFVWRQAVEYKKLGADAFYFAMFDEYDEGTAYMKGATDYFEIPVEQYFVTYAADGQWLSNDFYLRVAEAAVEYLKSDTEDTTMNIRYSRGPIYWRNSFEKRWTTWIEEVGGADWEGDTTEPDIQSTILMNVDVCAPTSKLMYCYDGDLFVKQYTGETDYVSVENDTNPDQYGTSREGTGIFRDVSGTYTKSGEWAFQYSGVGETAKADVAFLVASTDIMVSASGLELVYDLYAVNDGGREVYVDLVLDDNQLLSETVSALSTPHGEVGKWTNVTVELPASLVGRHIKYVAIHYQGGKGEFDAYIDDVIIQSPGGEKTMLQTAVATASTLEVESAALKAAVASAQQVLNNSVSRKEMLAAAQAIDDVLFAEGISNKPDVMMGDVDGNGKINTTDARLTLQYAAGRIDESELTTAAADVDGNGKINTTDARKILQYAAGRITSFT